MSDLSRNSRALFQIRLVHTLVWFIFAAATIAIPILALRQRLGWALWCSLTVWCEVLVLLFNRMRCPLTGMAERYTANRSDNFDIFLPVWLARNNKLIFGSLFAVSELLLLALWMAS
jgi:hypothetical protein